MKDSTRTTVKIVGTNLGKLCAFSVTNRALNTLCPATGVFSIVVTAVGSYVVANAVSEYAEKPLDDLLDSCCDIADWIQKTVSPATA